jgi:hypothetical protein
MPIPAFTSDGLLPEGVYDCTVEELRRQFGSFQVSDRRPKLFSQLEAFLAAARSSGLVRHVVIDGSFVTAESKPNDIDLIVIIRADYDFGADLLPSQYNVLSKTRVRKRFGFDLVTVREDTSELDEAIAFFERVRGKPALRKGILKLTL